MKKARRGERCDELPYGTTHQHTEHEQDAETPCGGCPGCQLLGCAHPGSGGPGRPCGPGPAPSSCPSPPHCSPEAWGCHAAPTMLLTKSKHDLVGAPVLFLLGMHTLLQLTMLHICMHQQAISCRAAGKPLPFTARSLKYRPSVMQLQLNKHHVSITLQLCHVH